MFCYDKIDLGKYRDIVVMAPIVNLEAIDKTNVKLADAAFHESTINALSLLNGCNVG